MMKRRTVKCVFSGIIVLAFACTLIVHGLSLAQAPIFKKAPLRPQSVMPLPPRTGFIPPPMDLSHLKGDRMPKGIRTRDLPSAWDWREQGKVTSIKYQGSTCGACYTFSYIATIESKVLIDSGDTYDFSENHAKECNWWELSDYIGPYGPLGSCDGGHSWMMTSLFSQKGTMHESCNPYVDSDVECVTTCPLSVSYWKTVLDWGVISGGVVPSTDVLKAYIHEYGPVDCGIYTGDESDPSWESEFGYYDGSYTLYYDGGIDYTTHAVSIVGWDDSLPHDGGSGGWIVKNSWGPGWGGACGYGTEGGYFTIAYGSALIGEFSNFIRQWQNYNTNGEVLYYDNFPTLYYGGGTTGWGLVVFVPTVDTNLTHVEFWTNDVKTDVDVYIYEDFDGTTPSTLLGSELNNSYDEAGYHSVELESPLPLTPGNDIIAVVKFTNASYEYPIPVDIYGPIETGRTYLSFDGSTWIDAGYSYDVDVAIRLRTSTHLGPAFCIEDGYHNLSPWSMYSFHHISDSHQETSSSYTVVNCGEADSFTWSASADQSWISVSPLNGTSGDQFVITCDLNPGPAERTGTVTVTAPGVLGSPKTFELTQAGNPNPCTDSDEDGYAIEGGECGLIDCDDGDASINPGADEICDDLIDNDCDDLFDGDDPECACDDSDFLIECGDIVEGTTLGGVDVLSSYLDCTAWNESGPEVIYSLTTATEGPLIAKITDLSVMDLDIFILADEDGLVCSDNCLAYGDTIATIEDAPAGTYHIVVDGYEGSEGDFALSIECMMSTTTTTLGPTTTTTLGPTTTTTLGPTTTTTLGPTTTTTLGPMTTTTLGPTTTTTLGPMTTTTLGPTTTTTLGPTTTIGPTIVTTSTTTTTPTTTTTTTTIPCWDIDGDGYEDEACGGTDCDDTDPNTHPGATEQCDLRDNDCDDRIDEGLCQLLEFGMVIWLLDLLTLDVEVCDNGVDDDHDGLVDADDPDCPLPDPDDGGDGGCGCALYQAPIKSGLTSSAIVYLMPVAFIWILRYRVRRRNR